MHHQQTFGIWLRQRRKALDLTQAQLAQQAGCSLSAIRQFERNVLRPSRQLAEQLAERLQIQPDLRIAFLSAAARLRRGQLGRFSPQHSQGRLAFLPQQRHCSAERTIWASCMPACFGQMCACLVSPVHQG